jgi:hypothetical protein
MAYVKTALIYQAVYVYDAAEYYKPYYAALALSVTFYPFAIYFYKDKQYWYSTYTHSMIHVCGNISNIILYSGHIESTNHRIFRQGIMYVYNSLLSVCVETTKPRNHETT